MVKVTREKVEEDMKQAIRRCQKEKKNRKSRDG